MYHFFRYYSQPIQNGQHARQGVLSILKPDCEAVIHPHEQPSGRKARDCSLEEATGAHAMCASALRTRVRWL